MNPTVRYLILCDDAQTDPHNPLRINVLGLMTHIRSTAAPPFPVTRPLFSALAVLTDCQGDGDLSLRIVRSDTGHVIYRTRTRRVRFAGTPQQAVGMVFRIRNCVFDAPGFYLVELIYSGVVLGNQPLTLTT